MTVYTYSTEMPYTNPVQNKRAFYKLPRSILLAPYLALNPYFVEYADAIDDVFDYLIEARSDALANIRNMWITTKELEDRVDANLMIDFTDWGGPERAMIVQQVNLLGMKLANAGVVSEGAYRAIAKFLGSYWFGKGKAAAIDFLNFCLGGGLTITKLVTEDYVHFYPDTSANVGAYIYDNPPGPWFPTTHVQIGMPLSYGVDPPTLGSFFYEICNYNLVLYAISQTLDFVVVSWDSETQANIVALGGFGNYILTGQTPYYPLLYHSRVGGWTGGVGKHLTQLGDVIWD
jgi:hypothetical protein